MVPVFGRKSVKRGLRAATTLDLVGRRRAREPCDPQFVHDTTAKGNASFAMGDDQATAPMVKDLDLAADAQTKGQQSVREPASAADLRQAGECTHLQLGQRESRCWVRASHAAARGSN